MKYDTKKLNSAIDDYKKLLGDIDGKTIFITINIDNESAFYSIAPLSIAIHELGGDLNVMGFKGSSNMYHSLGKVWELFGELGGEKPSKEAKLLDKFITSVDKKSNGEFRKIFKSPDMYFYSKKNGFEGINLLPYHDGWFKKHKWDKLLETADVIWKDVYNLKEERVGVGFILIPDRKYLELPLEDYLDSYPINFAMKEAAKKYAREVSYSASSPRMAQTDFPERISDLKATLIGCELDKTINEEPFKIFKQLSSFIGTDKILFNSANFHIAAKGYSGRHIFGQTWGYPTLNGKSRWSTPSGIIYKFDFFPQTFYEERDPIARAGFTETLPIDIFIETSLIDWNELTRKDHVIIDIVKKCQKIIVEGKKMGKYQTKFEVGLIRSDGEHRWAKGSDTELRNIINKDYFNRLGIKAGTMGNIPGGEMFITPEYVKGTIVGDVVIAIDQSYLLSEKEPFIIESSEDGYKVIKAPKKILEKFEKRKNDAWKLLEIMEKNKSLPEEIIEMKKRNFNLLGEFAINTNPKAKICDYLIVNEKIAGMIHVAMGSGFEADRSTEYHMDVVVNSIKQKHDIYGLDKKGKKYWIKKQGKFVI
ncbi:hypothetical protein ACFLZX_00195 [Nanoarchaeota archaeon]